MESTLYKKIHIVNSSSNIPLLIFRKKRILYIDKYIITLHFNFKPNHYVLLNSTIMDFKNFYKQHGRAYPIGVVKTAYGYTLHQHHTDPALSTASILHAAKFEQHTLQYRGYLLEHTKSGITVYTIETETQNCLLRFSSEKLKQNRFQIITQEGENCRYTAIECFINRQGCIFGTYTHRNHYVVLVQLTHQGEIPNRTIYEQMLNLANLLAKNTLAWYAAYASKNKEIKVSTIGKTNEVISEDFKQFLFQQPIRFSADFNPDYEYAPHYSQWTTIAGAIVEFEKQTGIKTELSDFRIFGM